MKRMLGKLYARWMYRWETDLTTRDTNRIVRPVEWGFDWLQESAQSHGFNIPPPADDAAAERTMLQLNDSSSSSHRVLRLPDPPGFRARGASSATVSHHVRPRTLQQDARFRRLAALGQLPRRSFCALLHPCAHHIRKRSCERPLVSSSPGQDGRQTETGNDRHAAVECRRFQPHALCSVFNRFGVSALRLSKPYHDIRRPASWKELITP